MTLLQKVSKSKAFSATNGRYPFAEESHRGESG
jgi:hypothetical protein